VNEIGPQCAMNTETTMIELDERGLEPPQPLMKTLEALASLPEGASLRVHTRWRPALLYAELERRGFMGQSEEQPDGSCVTYIRRR
jgi:tRNA 2-thiouridine synthesizing protein A